LPQEGSNLPAIVRDKKPESDFSNEREILYKVLFDMRSDLNDLKKLTMELMQNGNTTKVQETNQGLIQRIYGQEENHREFEELPRREVYAPQKPNRPEPAVVEQHHNDDEDDDDDNYLFAEAVEEEETLRLDEREIELIKKALERNKGKRKAAADELGISERTLYRKIKQYDL
jgi:DNA-binding NtrC family response regulator